MVALPADYQWVRQTPPTRMVQAALDLFGVHEVAGPGDNPTIMAWAQEAEVTKVYTADAVPWCGLFMAVVARRAGKTPVSDPLWALNWSKFGGDAGQPCFGDVLTFTRPEGGHVALYIGEDATAYHVLGGNQSDQVCFTRIDKHRLYAARRPPYQNQPVSVKPHILQAQGSLSANEA